MTILSTKSSRIFSNFIDIITWTMATFLAPTLVVLYFTYLYRHSLIYFLSSILPLSFFVIKSKTILDRLIKRDRDYVLKSFIVTGHGVRLSLIKLKNVVFLSIAYLFISLSLFTILHNVFHSLDIILIIIVMVLALMAIFMYYLIHVVIAFTKYSRRTAVEIEIPYFLALVKILSSVSIPFYNILSVIEKSVSLKAFAREVSFAKKISALNSTSLLTALDIVCLNHPSVMVREYVRRVVTAASTIGDIESVAEGTFEAIYTAFESRVLRLIERLTIIIGTALFIYMFIPIVVAVIAPVIGEGAYYTITVVVLSLQISAFLALYGITTSYYPSSIAITYTRGIIIVVMLSLSLAISLIVYNLVHYLVGAKPIDNFIIYVAIASLLAPGAVLSEMVYRRALLYDKFIRVASDAASHAIATGENYLSILERLSTRYGKDITKLVRRVSIGYTSEIIRKAVISKAPSLLHATFTEILMYALLYGVSPTTLKHLVSGYERITTIVSRIKSLAISIEVMLLGLSVIVGIFLTYLDKVFKDLYSIVVRVGGLGPDLTKIFIYNSIIHGSLDPLVMLSLIFLSMFVGKTRRGIIAFGFRTALSTLILYLVARALTRFLLT